ncbi:hypothetical protein Mapa_007356 [Marchantia paleacea]|nr:hypothetical protein Mapa_007356 [Marchantia paleacea]
MRALTTESKSHNSPTYLKRQTDLDLSKCTTKNQLPIAASPRNSTKVQLETESHLPHPLLTDSVINSFLPPCSRPNLQE